MSRPSREPGGAARSLLTPALCYLGVTVAVPVLTGAAAEPAYRAHAAWVVALCVLCVGAWMAVCRCLAEIEKRSGRQP